MGRILCEARHPVRADGDTLSGAFFSQTGINSHRRDDNSRYQPQWNDVKDYARQKPCRWTVEKGQHMLTGRCA